jgi:hypothetical protein
MESMAIIGCGTLGTRIANLLQDDVELHLTNRNADQRAQLKNTFANVYQDNQTAIDRSTFTGLTVRPQDMNQLLESTTYDTTTIINFTPERIPQPSIDIAMTPPTDNGIDILLYDATDIDPGTTAIFKHQFKPVTTYFKQTNDHVHELEELSRAYAHITSFHNTLDTPHAEAYLHYASCNTTPEDRETASTEKGLVATLTDYYQHTMPAYEATAKKQLEVQIP